MQFHADLTTFHAIYFTSFSILIANVVGAEAILDAPTLRLVRIPLQNAIEVFIEDTDCAAVTQWIVQYRETDGDSIKNISTRTDFFYSVRIDGLEPNTGYQVRARASQLYGDTAIAEENSTFSDWKTTRSAPLSVFGSVVLSNIAFTPQHNDPYSAEWNSSLTVIENGYTSIANEGISIIRIEDGGGNPRVHYRIRVEEKSLDTSSTKYILSGSEFRESYVNSGDRPLGIAYMYEDGTNNWKLVYIPKDGTSCPKLVERYMIVSPDDEDTFEIHLNVASSDATTADEEDGLRIEDDGSLRRDDGISYKQISLGTAIDLTPRFLLKDCLVGQPTVPLYSELFEGVDAFDTSLIRSHVYVNIPPPPVTVITSDVTHTSSCSGTCVTLHIPAVANAIRYEVSIASGETVASADGRKNGYCPDVVNITVGSLDEGTTYNFTLMVTTIDKESNTSNTTLPNSITVTPISPPTTTVTIPDATTPNPTTESPTSTAIEPSSTPTEAIITSSQTTFTAPATTSDASTTVASSTTSPETTTTEVTTRKPDSTIVDNSSPTSTSDSAQRSGPLSPFHIIIIVGSVFAFGLIIVVIVCIKKMRPRRVVG